LGHYIEQVLKLHKIGIESNTFKFLAKFFLYDDDNNDNNDDDNDYTTDDDTKLMTMSRLFSRKLSRAETGALNE